MKTVIVILIDQLKWDDHVFLPSLSKIFGKPQKYEVPYFPTITETAHASISTNSYQYRHGIVGNESFNISENRSPIVIKKIIDEYWPRNFEVYGDSIQINQFIETGVQTFVLAAKDKVARLIDPGYKKEGRVCRIFCRNKGDQENLDYIVSGNDLFNKNWDIYRKENLSRLKLKNFEDERIDHVFLEIAKEMLSDRFRDITKDAVFFIGLMYTDASGHKFGHHNQEFITGLKNLDLTIKNFISHCQKDKTSNFKFLILSDHGCREVKHYIWPSKDGKRLNIADKGVLQKVIDFPVEFLYTFVTKETEEPTIAFDGGTMRLWTKKDTQIKMKDFLDRELSPYIEKITSKNKKDELTDFFYHKNFGNILVYAKKDTAFCKRYWVEKNGNVFYPKGEHGSIFDEDRFVPIWGDLKLKGMVFDHVSCILNNTEFKEASIFDIL